MTDEIEVVETPAPEATDEAKATVELNDELVAEYLGVDADFFSKEVKPQAKGLDKLYAKLNKERAQQGRQQPEPAAPDVDDGEPELDERSKKLLSRFISEQIAPVIQAQQSVMQSEFENVLDTFSRDHTDVPADQVDAVMVELELWKASSPAQLAKNLKRAYKLAKADTFNPDAEVERRLAERLAQSKDDGSEVIEVKPKRQPQPETQDEGDIVQDGDIPWYKKMQAFS